MSQQKIAPIYCAIKTKNMEFFLFYFIEYIYIETQNSKQIMAAFICKEKHNGCFKRNTLQLLVSYPLLSIRQLLISPLFNLLFIKKTWYPMWLVDFMIWFNFINQQGKLNLIGADPLNLIKISRIVETFDEVPKVWLAAFLVINTWSCLVKFEIIHS